MKRSEITTLGKLRAKRDVLEKNIKRIVTADRQAKSRAFRTQQKKQILTTIKTLGGEESFKETYGQGARIVRKQYVDDGCSHTHEWRTYENECKYLGVHPNIVTIFCQQRGRYLYNGKRYCGIHLKMLFRMHQCGTCSSESQLRDQIKQYDTNVEVRETS